MKLRAAALADLKPGTKLYGGPLEARVFFAPPQADGITMGPVQFYSVKNGDYLGVVKRVVPTQPMTSPYDGRVFQPPVEWVQLDYSVPRYVQYSKVFVDESSAGPGPTATAAAAAVDDRQQKLNQLIDTDQELYARLVMLKKLAEEAKQRQTPNARALEQEYQRLQARYNERQSGLKTAGWLTRVETGIKSWAQDALSWLSGLFGPPQIGALPALAIPIAVGVVGVISGVIITNLLSGAKTDVEATSKAIADACRELPPESCKALAQAAETLGRANSSSGFGSQLGQAGLLLGIGVAAVLLAKNSGGKR